MASSPPSFSSRSTSLMPNSSATALRCGASRFWSLCSKKAQAKSMTLFRLRKLGAATAGAMAGGNGGGFGAGLSRDDVARNWGAYRIGCVTDRNLVAEPDEDRQLMLNVTVEWLGPEPLLRRADAEAAELVQALVNDAARNARRQQRRRLPPGPVPDAPDGGGPIDGARGQLLNTTLASLERGVAHERLPHAASVNLLR